MSINTLHRGHMPLLVSLPHVGIEVPDKQRWRYVERAFGVEDTDWHLETLYEAARLARCETARCIGLFES